ncbi:hypothetical protein [Haloarchaeobius sp. TZWWS8]|uniref:hypothetical protein n=1 Tax=Haloarchaeobius sp. TZWWS8 TaxID=3446121 RepID=UPI003EBD064A
MNRRTLLKRTAALAATGALAGCVADSPGAGGDGTEDRGDGTDAPTETEKPTPTLDSKSIETTKTGCGSGDDASVSFGNSDVAVDGSIRAPTPCHEATIADATFDASSGTLTVTVGLSEKNSDACAQCIGAIEYSASLAFANGLPSEVVVEHQREGESATVTTKSR